MKNRFEKRENEEWIEKILNVGDIEEVDEEQLILQVGIGTLLEIISEKLKFLNDEISRKRDILKLNYDDNTYSEMALLLLHEARIFEAYDCIYAITHGAKHPIQRYIDAARTTFGGNKLSVREIRFRSICVGFMEIYQVKYETSVLKSAEVVADAINEFIPRKMTASKARNYFNDRSSLGEYGKQQIELSRGLFERVIDQGAHDLFLELRFFAAASTSADRVRRLFDRNNPELLRTPPSSHQS